MTVRITNAVATIVLTATVLLGLLTPVDANAESKLAGSWVVIVTPDEGAAVRNVAVFTPDGLVVNLPGGGGIWTKVGEREYAVKFVSALGVSQTTTSTVTVDEQGDSATGPFTTVVSNSPEPVTGTVLLTRITFD